eukprot:358569-Chlamydomonas_euryale.AAC.3
MEMVCCCTPDVTKGMRGRWGARHRDEVSWYGGRHVTALRRDNVVSRSPDQRSVRSGMVDVGGRAHDRGRLQELI